MISSDRGSTIPLILGFFILALLMTAGAVAAGQAFVQQRDLQDVCDGAATAAAAASGDINRGAAIGGAATGGAAIGAAASLRFANVQQVVDGYLARDPSRGAVRITAGLSADARTLQLRCTQTLPVAFGAIFGRAGGVRQVATSSAQAPLS